MECGYELNQLYFAPLADLVQLLEPNFKGKSVKCLVRPVTT